MVGNSRFRSVVFSAFLSISLFASANNSCYRPIDGCESVSTNDSKSNLCYYASSDNDGMAIASIDITVENETENNIYHKDIVLAMMKTKEGSHFSSSTFDNDIKSLYKKYDKVVPSAESKDGMVYVHILLHERPKVDNISWIGNQSIKTKTLSKELGVSKNGLWDSSAFCMSLAKIQALYTKKGFFESNIDYKVIDVDDNRVAVTIFVNEGERRLISRITFSGISTEEENSILKWMNTKRHKILTGWFTHAGICDGESLERDAMLITYYLQSMGYANARVDISKSAHRKNRLELIIKIHKGDQFFFGECDVSGNKKFSDSEILSTFGAINGSLFSNSAIRDGVERIEKLYGRHGYANASVSTSIKPASRNTFDIHICVDEGDTFKVGLIHIYGNKATDKKVILRESLLIPGATLDTRKLEATEYRLLSMGYFKHVNVYATKYSECSPKSGDLYRDIIIEVSETSTGRGGLSFGLTTSSEFSGGVNISESNFDHKGFTKCWKNGLSAFRGGGEYAFLQFEAGRKKQVYSLSWTNPYLNDSKWRLSVELDYFVTKLQSEDYNIKSIGGYIGGGYPITSYWNYGWKIRSSHSDIDVKGIKKEDEKREDDNSGSISAISNSISFDSTDAISRPHKGLRSALDLEIGGVNRHSKDKDFISFFKLCFINSYYYPVWSKGTVRLRGDLRFILPMSGDTNFLPLSERFFLGGETTVRGYTPYVIGSRFKSDDINGVHPKGGVSSALFSIEYNQVVLRQGVDLFCFFDGGAISLKEFHVPKFKMSYGIGTRISIIGQLPLTLGLGFPINPDDRKTDVKKFFFAFTAQF